MSAGGTPTETVTFLFTDVVGSTALWQDEPDAMDPALAHHFQLLSDAIERLDGRVLRTTGDGVFAVFALGDQLAPGPRSWHDARHRRRTTDNVGFRNLLNVMRLARMNFTNAMNARRLSGQ
jgi:class 3 adenylate cyclase